ncbi:CDP-Ethanolamine:DAG ethanolamine phosphotransferase [Raphidocelis subcapitata]|uniref:CDP-Ethanolamine:DAG ethanolamine phosphotransferase n=1 Tax=Raphidocelis subcapitata TaxID=307507 RepID=A0A2V0NKR2_9CHLO|nr:CDP-Ethanolamine:DAG ethanolamine phosphotransferase [Raphidocelis subcapitata]|eukprot:GBF87918.1 CDP-Ethanolamine:DAG ethanolamine phosphotransferase [Raphidocelis subcapitata]
MPYLSRRALEGLRAYEYKPAGYTYLDKIHAPFYNWCVERLPMWLAPNLITLTGTIGLVIAYCVSAWYSPDFAADPDPPRWVFLLSAVAVVAYVHLDCLDGKQARRTKSSSPLGQLFDHGCDALSVNLLLANIGVSLSMPCSWAHGLGNFGVMLTWILAQWEEYHTSIMLYGNSFYGVLEANYCIAAVHLVTFVAGPQLWRLPATAILPLKILEGVQLNSLLITMMVFVGSYQGLCNMYRVFFSFDHRTLTAKEAGHKQLGLRAAVLQFIAIVAPLAISTVWLWAPTTEPFLCRATSINVGLVYALMASRLIMAHMCKEPFAPPLLMIAGMAVGAANSRLRLASPLALTVALDAVALLAYLHYVLSVINEICAFLGIRCLSLQRPAAAAGAAAEDKAD